MPLAHVFVAVETHNDESGDAQCFHFTCDVSSGIEFRKYNDLRPRALGPSAQLDSLLQDFVRTSVSLFEPSSSNSSVEIRVWSPIFAR